MPNIVMAMSSSTVTVPAGQSITVFTQADAKVYQVVSSTPSLLDTVTTSQMMFGPFANGAEILIVAGQLPAVYSIGSAPVIPNFMSHIVQRAPIIMNTGGAIPAAALSNGIITSNSLLGISCSLPTGASIEAISNFRADDAFDWCVMAVGLFGYTVTASAGHTFMGAAAVSSGTSGYFRTRKLAANSYITYRVS